MVWKSDWVSLSNKHSSQEREMAFIQLHDGSGYQGYFISFHNLFHSILSTWMQYFHAHFTAEALENSNPLHEGCRTSHQKFKPQSLWLHTKSPPLIHNSWFFKGATGLSTLGNPDEKEWIFSYVKWQLFKESMHLMWNENIFFMRNMRSIHVFIFQSPQFTRISLGCFCQSLKNSSLWFFWCKLI